MRMLGVEEFIAKQGSPSCGCGNIYYGTFTGRVIIGDGVKAAFLKRSGLIVISKEQLE